MSMPPEELEERQDVTHEELMAMTPEEQLARCTAPAQANAVQVPRDPRAPADQGAMVTETEAPRG